MKIFFAYAITESAGCLIIVLSAIAKKPQGGKVTYILGFNGCLGIAALILLGVYRFQYSGKVCSCDIEDRCFNNGKNPDDGDYEGRGYLTERGKYLKGLFISMFVVPVFLMCVFCAVGAKIAKH